MTIPLRSVTGDLAAARRDHTGEGDRSCAESAPPRFVSERLVAKREPRSLPAGSACTHGATQTRTHPMNAATIVIQAGFLMGLSLGLLVLV
jgi:hypothetical protein